MPGFQFAAPGFLAWGWILIGVPIAIHLLMRKKPTQLDFPTLRFLRAAQQKQSRRIQFQHLLLLLLRIALILLMVLAFSRPQIKLRQSAMTHDEPVDAVLLVDTSLSMQAVVGGMTLLRRSRSWGRGFFEGLPKGSRVALMTAQLAPLEWHARPQALDRKLAELEPQEAVISLGPTIRRARKLMGQLSDRPRALYILTDLTRTALPPGLLEGWPDDIPVQLVDLAGVALDNLYLDQLKVSMTSVMPGTPVTVSGVVAGYGRAGRMTLELIVAGRTLESTPIDVPASGRAPFRFTFRARTPGVLQGRVRIREQDALPRDNALYFTVKVFRALPLLVVSDALFSQSARWKWLHLGLDPEERGKRLRVKQRTPEQLDGGSLSRFRVVILPDVAGMTDAAWAALELFVVNGGGLLVLPGPGVQLPEWRTRKAREVLGVEIVGPEPLPRNAVLGGADWTHPLLAPFENGANGDLMGVDWRAVMRIAPSPQAKVLAKLGKLPAILERPLGRGRVLLLAGGIHPRWGELIQSYAFVPFLAEALKYLARLGTRQVNYRAGETARLAIPRGRDAHRVRLVGPSGASRVVAISPRESFVALQLDDGPGHYSYLLEGRRGVSEEGGFSANFPTEESDLTRLEPAQVGSHLGLDRLVLLKTSDSLDARQTGGTRVRELTALVALLLLLLLTLESYVSTFRYR